EGHLRADLADDPARLVLPVIPGSPHREERLLPDHLADVLEADPGEAGGDFGGVGARMPDVADREGGNELVRLRPVGPRVARDGRVALALRAPLRAAIALELAAHHVRLRRRAGG